MASIYRNALLTLAATAATGPKDGLFYSARPELRNQKPLELGRFNVPFPVYTRPHMRYDVGHLMHGQEHSLLERGWVLQERLLSPRVVYFGANEVAWECMTCTACECEPQMLPHVVGTYSPREPFNPKAAFSQSVNRLRSNTATEIEEQLPELWHHIVNAYTGLQLTYPKDKFSALSGLVTEIERVRPGDVYLAGLWRNTFMLDILWRRQRINDWHSSAFDEHYDVENVMGSDSSLNEFQKQFKQRERRSERTARTHREYLAPTWSWACVHTQIEYDKEINSRSLHLIDPEFAKLLSVCCIAKYKNPKGELQSDSSYAVLRGKIAQVELKGVKIEDYKLYRNGQALTFSDPDYNLISPTGSRTKLHNGSTLYCFRIATGLKKSNQTMGNVYGLVLHAKENGGEPATEYERVGMFQYVHTIGKEWSVFDGIKEEVNVKIV